LEPTVHDHHVLLADAESATRRLARRGFAFDPEPLRDLSSRRVAAIKTGDDLRAQSKQVAAEVQRQAKAGGDIEGLKAQARELKEKIKESETEVAQLQAELREVLLGIPNFPLDEIPDGFSEEEARELRTWGEVPKFDFEPKDHVDLAEAMGIFDFGRATKLAGPRFAVGRSAGARLERGLVNFLLDLHTQQHGYEEFSVPHLVNAPTMTGTGQLPKFEEDLFKTSVGDRALYLIPTAEVPLTNFYANEIIDRRQLPLAFTTHTPCYRSEAGSYGRDTRGILRLHQFAKVEMVRLCEADQALTELEKMLGHAEACLQKLGLAYRVVVLAAGDTGFSSEITYDLEVWLPSQDRYREISSCSSCNTFQARRANIRTTDADGNRQFVATLNGSGLPIGRTVAAILEQGQQEDGSVVMPEALVPYLGFSRIQPDGKTV
jgi:seryl-tRNA synthetase